MNWLTKWLTGWLSDYKAEWLAVWVSDWMACWLTGWLKDWLFEWWLTVWETGCWGQLAEAVQGIGLLSDLSGWLFGLVRLWITGWVTGWGRDCHGKFRSVGSSYLINIYGKKEDYFLSVFGRQCHKEHSLPLMTSTCITSLSNLHENYCLSEGVRN